MATLAHNLDVRRDKVKAAWPEVQVGWIGDVAHQAEASDHNPDSAGVVHAIDVMVPLGERADLVVAQCLAHHDDLEYVIHDHKIWPRSHNWTQRAYTGSDPHTNHVHISGKHGTAHEDKATGTGYDLSAEKATPQFDLEDDMDKTQSALLTQAAKDAADCRRWLAQLVNDKDNGGAGPSTSSFAINTQLRKASAGPDVTALAKAFVAALPPASAGILTQAQIEAAVRTVLREGVGAGA